MLNIISYQGNTNENHFTHTRPTVIKKRHIITGLGEDVEKSQFFTQCL